MLSPLVIANLQAGTALRRARLIRRLRALQRDGRLALVQTSTIDAAAQQIAAATQAGRRVIVVGGDGTIQQAVAALLSAVPQTPSQPPPVGLVPAGRGNDLCRSLGIPLDLDEALDVALAAACVRPLDVGRAEIDGRPCVFTNALGVGFDAAVAVRARSLPLAGFPAYLVAALASVVREPGRWQLTAELAGEIRSGEFLLFTIGNGATTGGGFRITPQADPGDGELDFCAARARGRLDLLRLLPLALLGRHVTRPGVELGRLRAVAIESPRGVPVHADGEPLAAAARRIVVRLAAGAVQVVVPRPAG